MRTAILMILVGLVFSGPTRAEPRVGSVESKSFRVQVVGRGRPMILIPGLSSSGDTWKTTVARYEDRFTCHVLTVAGLLLASRSSAREIPGRTRTGRAGP